MARLNTRAVPPRIDAFISPLRYPGGKGKLVPFFRKVLELNGLIGAEYAEPYAGGCAVGLALLTAGYCSRVHLNDIDRSIYLFWKVALQQPDALCKKIRDTKVTPSEWRRQRKIHENLTDHSDIEIAFSTFFLNRTNRSGIIRGGGMIGGNEQKGKWRLDARYYRDTLITRIERLARLSNSVKLYNLDAEVFLQGQIPLLPNRSLIYLDPPYYKKGHKLYQNYYSKPDHKRLAELIQCGLTDRWIVSYDRAAYIETLYCQSRRLTYKLPHTATTRRTGSEVMFFGTGLQIPSVQPEESPKSAAA
jgi:DNA adenine methylase